MLYLELKVRKNLHMGVGVADSLYLGRLYLIIGSYQSGIKQRRSKEISCCSCQQAKQESM